jgi:ribosomal protein S12 methylthiotransferase accessory factor
MFETIHRPYKERSAEETVALVKEILTPLDLLPEEAFRASPYPGLYSVSLVLPAAKGEFRTNGKGRTSEYCLASGYAEFIERIQNGLFASFPRTIVSHFKQRYGYYYAPDERYLTAEEFAALPAELVNDIVRYNGAGQVEFMAAYHERASSNGAPGVVAVPFYDTQGRRLANLPLNLLLLTVGSNGMAAGNTQAEALHQALCELLERWGAAEVFYGQLTPPTAPREYLAQFKNEMAIIQAIEASGRYRVTIKDFSAGRRIPALGILVEIPEANKYRLNVGCDTCFQVALSRCLTEIYQGVSNETVFDEAALPRPAEEAPYFLNNDELSMHQRYSVFSQFTVDNRGQFPLSLFASEPSYPFDPAAWTQRSSYVEEVQRLVAYFHGQGYNVYMRDVSFLGFPSVLCYVPEVSALGRKNVPLPVLSRTPLMFQLDRIESKALKLRSCSDAELEEIAGILEYLGGRIALTEIFGIKLKQTSPWTEYHVALLLSQVWYKLGRFDKARDAFKLFLKIREGDKNPYYELAGRYLERRGEGLTAEAAAQGLAEDPAHTDLARQVAEDLADPAAALRFVLLPNCPDCSECDLRSECVTTGRLSVMERLLSAMASRKIDQATLSWVN